MSLLPSLRASADGWQANFVNPGLLLFNAGVDAAVTSRLKASINLNYLRFHRTEALERLLGRARVPAGIGLDWSAGFQYRPYLNENLVVTGGAAGLAAADGLRNILGHGGLYSTFLAVRLTY
jgi:hypothetical protein